LLHQQKNFHICLTKHMQIECCRAKCSCLRWKFVNWTQFKLLSMCSKKTSILKGGWYVSGATHLQSAGTDFSLVKCAKTWSSMPTLRIALMHCLRPRRHVEMYIASAMSLEW
jgi:hypothetical protein